MNLKQIPSKKMLEKSQRPWGYYKIIYIAKGYKLKEIRVYPNQRLSYQRHKKRSEHWYIVEGRGRVTLDDRIIDLGVGDSVNIEKDKWHRIENISSNDLIFIEIQQGEYLEEDDIERIEDDYGRVN